MVALALWIRHWSELRTPTHPVGDLASDGIMVELAHNFELNHGHYSQFGLFHPGAAMFYVESVGEFVFSSLFHLFPNGYDASWATVLLVNAALIGSSAFCLGVAFNSNRVVVASTTGFLVFAIAPTRLFPQSVNGLLLQSWVPVQTIWCVLFLACTLVYLTSLKPSAFLLIGLSATWMAQRYIVLVPIAAACLAFGWIVAWRTVDQRQRARYLWLGVVSIVVLSIPNLIGIVFEWPWQFSNYWHAAVHPQKSPRTITESLSLVASYWGIHNVVVLVVALLLGAVAIVGVYRMKASSERTGYLAIIAITFVATAVAVMMAYGVDSQVDQLHAYELSFYLGIVALGYGAIAIALFRRWLAFVVGPFLLVFGDFGGPPATGFLDMGQAQRAIVRSAHGQPIQYVSLNDSGWIWTAGILLDNIQSGIPSCAVSYNSGSAFVYAPQHVCAEIGSAQAARFVINPGYAVPDGTTVYTSSDLDIVKLPASGGQKARKQ